MGSTYHHLIPPGGTPKVTAVWIDDVGREINHDFIAFDLSARRYAFKHMRMVELVQMGTDIIVRWNVKHVSPMAVMTAAAILSGKGSDIRVTLEFFWGGWIRERDYTPARALHRMIDAAPFTDAEPFLGTMVLARNPETVRSEGDLIRRAFEYWDSNAARAGQGTGPDSMGPLSNYSLAFSYNRAETDLLVRHVGHSSTAISVFGGDWATDALGRSCLKSQPDFEYEDQVCRDYEKIMASGNVQIDHVRAFIRRPDNDPVWFTYKRLLLRSRNSMGVPTLVAFSEKTDDIAIPIMAA